MSVIHRDRALNGEAGSLSLRFGAVHVVATGAVTVLTGLGLFAGGAGGGLLALVYQVLPLYMSESAMLHHGALIGFLATDAALVVGVLVVVIGLVQVRTGWLTLRGGRVSYGVAAAVPGLFNPMSLPLAAVGVTLLALTQVVFNP
ncbi:hypothetical protein [Halosimplex amylolyticum]|uniref:hypothetical protein n=1 Tax=Halosimplex amylolyticum TaxID=3396616 RepID=UPI003F547B6D